MCLGGCCIILGPKVSKKLLTDTRFTYTTLLLRREQNPNRRGRYNISGSGGVSAVSSLPDTSGLSVTSGSVWLSVVAQYRARFCILIASEACGVSVGSRSIAPRGTERGIGRSVRLRTKQAKSEWELYFRILSNTSGVQRISREKEEASRAERPPTSLIEVEAITVERRLVSNWSRFWWARTNPTLYFLAWFNRFSMLSSK